MLKHLVELTVQNANAQQFYDFMIAPVPERYRAWWPGEHLDFRIVKPGDSSHLGDVVFMDEYLGGKSRRLTFHAIVVKAAVAHPPTHTNQIIWQMKKAGLRLPAFVNLELTDTPGGLLVKHELRLGFSGIGAILDPLIRLYFNKSFRDALETHCKIEWPKLAEYLKDDADEN